MGLLDKLEKRNRRQGLLGKLEGQSARRRFVPSNQLPKARWGTHWVTPAQGAAERRRQTKQVTGLLVGIVGWIPALALGGYALVLTLPLGVLFTALAVAIAFSRSNKEVTHNSWKAWREFRSFILELVKSRKR